jgi:uncharacterized membrane protein
MVRGYPSTVVEEHVRTLPAVADRMTARWRIVAAATAGAGTGALMSLVMPWQGAVLLGWIAFAGVFLGWVLRLVTRDDLHIADAATRDDPGRVAASVVEVTASVGCLVGVGFALDKANEGAGHYNIALVVLGIVSVLASWAVLHSVYLLHYARLYYGGDVGGIDFNDSDPPTFADFAYLAFTVGMTYQVSDTSFTTRQMRRHALSHAVLSFLFGTFILAVTVNVVAGFVR